MIGGYRLLTAQGYNEEKMPTYTRFSNFPNQLNLSDIFGALSFFL